MKQKPFTKEEIPGIFQTAKGMIDALVHAATIDEMAKKQPELRKVFEIEEERKLKTGFRTRVCSAILEVVQSEHTKAYFNDFGLDDLLWLDDVLSYRLSSPTLKAVHLKKIFKGQNNWTVFNTIRILHTYFPSKVKQIELPDYKEASDETKQWFNTMLLDLAYKDWSE